MRSSKVRAFDNVSVSSTSDGPTLEKHLRGHKDCITAVQFNPTMKQIVTSSVDSSLLLWNLENSVRAFRFVAHKEAVHDVAFSPSGNLIASASRDRTVRFWTPAVYGSSGEFRAHTAAVRSVQFSPDGKNLITSSDDKTVKLWAVAKKRFIHSFSGHTNWVRCARFSGDGRIIASCADDKNIKLFDPNSGKCIHSFEEDKAHAVHLSWHPSGTCFAVALTNSVIRIYDIRALKLVQHYRSHEKPVNQVTFHPSGDYLLSASDDSTMKIIDVIEGRPIYTLQGHEGAATAVSFSPDGQYFASTGVDKQVFVWKTNFDKQDWRSSHSEDKCSLNETNADRSSPVTQCYDARSAISKMKQTNVDFTTVQSSSESCDSVTSDDIRSCAYLGNSQAENGKADNNRNGTRHEDEECEHVRGLLSSGDGCDNSNYDPVIAGVLEKVTVQLEVLRKAVELLNQRLSLVEKEVASLTTGTLERTLQC